MVVKRYYCNVCKKDITKGELLYSLDKFDRPLCQEHQRLERKLLQTSVESPPAQNIRSQEMTINESETSEKQSKVGSLLKKGLLATGKGIAKGVKKISDSTKKTMQIRRWKEDILRRMYMNQLQQLCFEHKVSIMKSELKKNTSGGFYRKQYHCTKGDLVSRLKNNVSLDDIISFSKRNHINIRDILSDIDRKKAEWDVKEITEIMKEQGVSLLLEIEKAIIEFRPLRNYYREEILYQDTLAAYLKKEFPGGDVRVEVTRGPVRPDIVVNEIAIEVKGPTRDKDLETISHKCMLYNQYFPCGLICVLFNVYVNQLRYEAWLRAMKNNYPNVIIIKK
jgi:hypothetical protein